MFSAGLMLSSFKGLDSRREVVMRQIQEAHRQTLITELKRAIDQKDAFMSSVSHELRTPLNGIIGEAPHAPSQQEQYPAHMPSVGVCCSMQPTACTWAGNVGGVDRRPHGCACDWHTCCLVQASLRACLPTAVGR